MTSLLRRKSLNPVLVGVACGWLGMAGSAGEPMTLFSTGFEADEGYLGGYELIGQEEWNGEAPEVSAVDVDLVQGVGRHAYIGFHRPHDLREFAYVFRPVDFNPADAPIVEFSVRMAIVDSWNGEYDNFRWSVYNTSDQRLFSVDFDNFNTNIFFLLDGTNTWQETGQHFTNDVMFDLVIRMEFDENRWSAEMAGTRIIIDQPITTVGSELTLSDVSAVWAIYDAQAPGDNFMVFDDYRITARPTGVVPSEARIELSGFFGKDTVVRLHGEAAQWYAIETSTNRVNWVSLKTNLVVDGYFDFVHAGGATDPLRFYRGRRVP